MDSIYKLLKIHYDNTSVTLFFNNNKNFSTARHIQRKYVVVKKRIRDHLVSIEQINTKLMIADLMTKVVAPKDL